jgi:predicted nuclease of predicted toxin-antitoxin system
VRLFLDAHISGRRIAARALRRRDHDVRAADEERQLDGATDEALLELATDENRIMVTFNVADFPDIARRWAEADRPHAGLIIVVGIDHREFGTILRAIDRCFATRPGQPSWNDLTLFVSRTGQ